MNLSPCFSGQLHSSVHADWSFTPGLAQRMLRCDGFGQPTRLFDTSGLLREWADPLDALRWMENSFTASPTARWIGYLSYDLGRCFEQVPAVAPDDLALPLFIFTHHDNSGSGLPAASPQLPYATTMQGALYCVDCISYQRKVRRAIDYIEAGDVFQVNLSHRLAAPLTEQPAALWRRLRERFPAAYGAYLDYGDHALLCNSPELFLRVDRDRATGQRQVITRPIKGTRPNAPGMEQALRDSAKDQAELNMIIDLLRNDLGRICTIGSVRVTQGRTIEAHPTVLHGVASIAGTLRHDATFVDLLAATFPGGSVTGAPKIRAMQIIDQLEPVRRGPYCGAIGYLASDGNMQLNIAIRTMIVHHATVYIPVGGGIVADSDPAAEFDETMVKARALLDILKFEI